MALSKLQIKKAKAKERPYKLADGEGLFLLVQPNGSKLWRLKYRYRGKEKLLSFGAYPDIGIDAHRRDDERLADVGAALLVDDLDQFGLEVSARRGIGHLQNLLHPVIEALGRAVEQHQRGVAGDEFEIMCLDAAAAECDAFGRNGNKHERFWRDLRVHSILEGTNEVMRMIVGKDLLRQ